MRYKLTSHRRIKRVRARENRLEIGYSLLYLGDNIGKTGSSSKSHVFLYVGYV